MPTFRGFVDALQTRDDGWVEFAVLAPHANNQRHTFFIPDIDGDITKANRRLAWLSLLRDALARTLPLEVDYTVDPKQGDLIDDLSVFPRPSIEGRIGGRIAQGVVISVAIAEIGPLAGTTPYRDFADLAAIWLLEANGNIEQLQLDLQRPDPLTAQAMLTLLNAAHRTRRPIRVQLSESLNVGTRDLASRSGSARAPFVVGCEWIAPDNVELDYTYAFVERLEQRHESYEATNVQALSQLGVVYTSAPGQSPEGDISDNGSFVPVRGMAWVHGDSPLVTRLEAALRDGLQVRLGLLEKAIHEVDLVSPMGSAALPIWICAERTLLPYADSHPICENVPTIQTPGAAALGAIPVSVCWKGQGYFQKGIWRIVVRTPSPVTLTLDGQAVCCASTAEPLQSTTIRSSTDGQKVSVTTCHAFLCGIHTLEIAVRNHSCADAFSFMAYRIR